MKAWLASLSVRERAIVLGGIVLAVVIVGWGFIWTPLTSATAELRVAVADKSQLIVDLRRAEGIRSSTGNASSSAAATQSLLVLVNSTAGPYNLVDTFTRTRPNGPDEINVSFQRAPFDVLVSWLIELEQSFGIRVDSASFNGAPQPGLVNGQLSLSRS